MSWMSTASKPGHIHSVCRVVDIPLCRGESWGESEWVLGVISTQGGTVVAEAVVGPPGFRILVLACKQQRTGTPTRPRALAVEGLGCVSEVPRVLFLGICLDFYYCLRRVLVPKFGFHFDRGSVSQALVKPRLVPP